MAMIHGDKYYNWGITGNKEPLWGSGDKGGPEIRTEIPVMYLDITAL